MINCDHCNKSFKYPCFLEKHLSRKIPCFMKSPTENMILNDKSKSTTNEAVVCLKVEDMVCIDEEKVCEKEEVCQKVRKKNHACTTCDKTFYNKSALEKHIPKCNGGIDTLQCPVCLKWFSHRNAKYAHDKNVKCRPPEETDNQGRTKKHSCTKCNKTFYNKRDCEKHIQKCNGCDVLQCPTCLKYFSSYSTKSEHIKNVKCKPPEPLPEPKEPPRVIRKVTTTVNLQIGASQSWKCNNCYDQLKSTFHIDHIIPICRGGTNVEDNLQALCVECHAQKTQKERQI